MMSECVECGSAENVVDHHVQYEPEETVPVCRTCRGKIHYDESHYLHPIDDVPDGFTRDYPGAILTINEETRNELRKFKAEHGVTYDEAISVLLQNSGWGYGTE